MFQISSTRRSIDIGRNNDESVDIPIEYTTNPMEIAPVNEALGYDVTSDKNQRKCCLILSCHVCSNFFN
jgi:CHASE1-domain containing sensor protein